MQHPTRLAIDGAAVTASVASWVGYLPPIASAMSMLWIAIQVADWAWKKWKGKG